MENIKEKSSDENFNIKILLQLFFFRETFDRKIKLPYEKDDKESHEIKKIILECILEDSETSKDLKEYADESLKNKDKLAII